MGKGWMIHQQEAHKVPFIIPVTAKEKLDGRDTSNPRTNSIYMEQHLGKGAKLVRWWQT